ncbi:hypothetical protein LX32DRAFT_647120 [Colletotrichum zoysiae]|uniref:Uncharacterized protein n=1 Tax=Colletotrichum zoysiae TaxID=1216348 RepID=A0AAD9H3B9_9PEZI|nr:hypothetical protein LX32DRAFT_647120 [Colletotrichum zoysiae]
MYVGTLACPSNASSRCEVCVYACARQPRAGNLPRGGWLARSSWGNGRSEKHGQSFGIRKGAKRRESIKFGTHVPFHIGSMTGLQNRTSKERDPIPSGDHPSWTCRFCIIQPSIRPFVDTYPPRLGLVSGSSLAQARGWVRPASDGNDGMSVCVSVCAA